MAIETNSIGARGATGILVASAIAATSGLAISLIAARTLEPEETAQFLIFWGILFGIYGTLSGVQHESTRAVKARPTNMAHQGARVIWAGLIIGASAAIAVLAVSPLISDRLIPAGQPLILVALALAVLLYAAHATLAGAAAGLSEWNTYSGLMAVESAFRLLIVVVVAVLGAGLLGLQFACMASVLVWIVFVALSPRARVAFAARSDATLWRLVRNDLYSIFTSASIAALVVGYPVIFGATSSPEVIQSAAGILLAVQITRAPILIPLQAFQGVAIAAFVDRRRGLRDLTRPVLLIAGVALIGAGLATLVGPWIMLAFGESYVVNGWVLGALTLGGGGLGVLTLTGAASLAVGQHRSYLLGWMSATILSVLLLLLPGSAEARVIISLCIAPLVGILIHAVGIHQGMKRFNADGGADD